MIFKIIKKVMSLPYDFLMSLQTLRKGTNEIRKLDEAKVLLLYDQRAILKDCSVTPDMGWVTPKGTNLRFRNEHGYILEPDNKPLFIAHIDNLQTLNMLEPPTVDDCDRDDMETSEFEGKVVKTYNIEEFRLKGGRIVTEMSYLIGVTGLLKLLEPPSKKEIIYIALVSLLVGIIIGVMGLLMFG